MKSFELVLAIASFLLLASGMVFKKNKRSPFSEPIVGLAAGILLGPQVLRVLQMQEWGPPEQIMRVACQLTISMALLATAFRIPKGFFLQHKGQQTKLVLLGMIGMFLVSGFIIKLVFGFDWTLSFLIGAVITPTDPVLASTIVSGQAAEDLLPERIRHTISFESGANDGMAYSLVLLPMLLLEKGSEAVTEWMVRTVLYETVGGIVLGMVIGYLAAKTLVLATAKGWTAKPALLVFSLSLGFFVLGLLELIHMNAIVGVFAAGFIANHELSREEDIEQEEVQEAMERIFTLPVFFLFGLILPWHDWLMMGWKAAAVVAGILLLRRLPVLFALGPLLKFPKKDDLAFIGWFGPIGVAALFYAMHALHKTGHNEVWHVASLIIFASTIIHGITGYHFAKWYNKKHGKS
ncbi:cation:proton antiporter [Aridibaculum aurantiacum]|uniref:cation:proton antiporter n=1 Tax=Aridibaculum aurantiacum TaxID=2810307 RepID=UPI001A9648A7|nr:sodium:proton antiporter [Aridibaculum aurantiacum]